MMIDTGTRAWLQLCRGIRDFVAEGRIYLIPPSLQQQTVARFLFMLSMCLDLDERKHLVVSWGDLVVPDGEEVVLDLASRLPTEQRVSIAKRFAAELSPIERSELVRQLVPGMAAGARQALLEDLAEEALGEKETAI
jgi:hypothetical protein